MTYLRILPRSSVGNVSSSFISPFSILVAWVMCHPVSQKKKEVALCDYMHFLDEIMVGMCLICALLLAFIQFLP
jgi:hypothetical protein